MELDSDEEKNFSILERHDIINHELPRQCEHEYTIFNENRDYQLDKLFSGKSGFD